MTTPAVDQEAPFSEVLKKATWSDHGAAESTDYVHQLFKGELALDEYAALVVQHYPVYVALENAAAAIASDPAAAPFVIPELYRVAALEEDLEALLGADWRTRIEPLPSTRRYVERIEEVCSTSPQAYVAHHYTRYLGDLSGGQMIGRAVSKAYGFGDAAGARFYVFDQVDDPKAFKERYRAMLDALPWDQAGRDAMVAEVVRAYALNSAQLAELGDVVIAARS